MLGPDEDCAALWVVASVAEPVRFESALGKKIIGSRYKKSGSFSVYSRF